MVLTHHVTACFLVALLVAVAADDQQMGLAIVPDQEVTGDTTVYTQEALNSLRLRELRRIVADRGLTCDGCTEKGMCLALNIIKYFETKPCTCFSQRITSRQSCKAAHRWYLAFLHVQNG